MEIVDLTHLQLDLVRHGILVRGCITVGEAYHRSGAVFGPGVLRAHQIESKHATHPRIIVDPLILGMFREPGLAHLLKKLEHSVRDELDYIGKFVADIHGSLPYVDYLRGMGHEIDDPLEQVAVFREHQALVTRGYRASRHHSRVNAKFRWLAQYHNRTVRSLSRAFLKRFGLSCGELLVPLRE
jgi:hypothetical protein